MSKVRVHNFSISLDGFATGEGLALMGVRRALTSFTRAQIIAGVRNPALARTVRTRGRRALATLAQRLDHLGAH
jgi:hypothetical protein